MSLRERKREKTRIALIARAMELFEQRGFDGTSVDAIAEAAEVSRRTFFRYFETKESVFFAPQQRRLSSFIDMLEERRSGEKAYDAVRRVLFAFARSYVAEREQLMKEYRIIADSRSLQAHELQIDLRWEHALARHLALDAVETRHGQAHGAIVAGAIIGMSHAVLRSWYAGGAESDLVGAAEAGFRVLEEGIRRRL